jgi:hypothetical protein
MLQVALFVLLIDTSYLNDFFPKFTRDDIYLFFYTSDGQDVSVGNYWNDPYHQDLYYANNVFLPLLNNGTQPGTFDHDARQLFHHQ